MTNSYFKIIYGTQFILYITGLAPAALSPLAGSKILRDIYRYRLSSNSTKILEKAAVLSVHDSLSKLYCRTVLSFKIGDGSYNGLWHIVHSRWKGKNASSLRGILNFSLTHTEQSTGKCWSKNASHICLLAGRKKNLAFGDSAFHFAENFCNHQVLLFGQCSIVL